MNKIYIITCSLCVFDFWKESMIFHDIIGYTSMKTFKNAIATIFIMISVYLLILAKIPYKYASIFFVPLILFALWIKYSGITFKMIVSYLISYVCICQIDVLIESILIISNARDLSEMQIDLVCAAISIIVVYAITQLCRRYQVKNIRESSPPFFVFLLLSIILLVGFMLGTVSNILKDNIDLFYGQILYLVVCILSILITGIGFILYTLVLSIKRHEALEELNQKILHMQKEYYEELRIKNNDIRKFRHDMKDHFVCLRYFIQHGKTEEALNYFDTMEINLNSLRVKSVGNDIVDAILNEKGQEAQRLGIEFEVKGRMPQDTQIGNYELCIIFANAINNAIEACNKLQDKKKIKVTLGEFHGFLSITIKNTSRVVSSLKTTKKDPQNHGYGLNNILGCVEKLHGNTKISQKGNCFSIEILLKL